MSAAAQFEVPAIVPADPDANISDLLIERVKATPSLALFAVPEGSGEGAGWRDITAARSRQLLGFETVTWELRVTGDALDRSSLAREQYATNGVALAQLLDRLAASSGTSFTLPVATLSRSVSAMLDGLVLRWLVDGDATAAAEQLDLLADTLAGLARQS